MVTTQLYNGVRVAVEGCGHGTLKAIYSSVARSCKERKWNKVDLLIIGGDFQSVRNGQDLAVMACPAKYRQMGDFPDYYSGASKAPYTTIFIGGNHEASSHLWELYYGGWVAPNIYYMGAANVLRFGPLRIAALSGIWKGYDYQKPHFERLPFSHDDVRSIYHVREIDVRKLLLLRTQVDVGLSHDWPRGIERHGDMKALFKKKPDFRKESDEGTLGNVAAAYVLDRLRPPYWFSAHLHIKFAALKTFAKQQDSAEENVARPQDETQSAAQESVANPDEIDLDLDDDDGAPSRANEETRKGEEIEARPEEQPQSTDEARKINPDEIQMDLDDDGTQSSPSKETVADEKNDGDAKQQESCQSTAQTHEINPNEIDLELDDNDVTPSQPHEETQSARKETTGPVGRLEADKVSDQLQVQHPVPPAQPLWEYRRKPGQPVPPGITNKEVRFLALDKCLPGRKFLQLCEIHPFDKEEHSRYPPKKTWHRYQLEYDPEWLAITRVFHSGLSFGDPSAQVPKDLGEEAYIPLIDAERKWVEEHVVQAGKLAVPKIFTKTALPYTNKNAYSKPTNVQPEEYTNPQTAEFCKLLDIENLWDMGKEDREERRRQGPPTVNEGGRESHGGGRGRGGGWGRGRGRGRGRGGGGGGRGRRGR